MTYTHDDAEEFLRTALIYRKRIDDALAHLDVSDSTGVRAILTGTDPDEHASTATAAGVRTPEDAPGEGTDGLDSPDAPQSHTRDHHRAEADAWADTATTTGGTTGITYALTAIAHAILAGQETHP